MPTGTSLYGQTNWRRPVLGVLNAPPTEPTGKRYVVGDTPTGAFANHAKDIARHDGTQWLFETPEAGWQVYNKSAATQLQFTGSSWAEWPAGGPGGTVYWGDIDGTLTAQSDLSSALDDKAAANHNHDSDYDVSGAAASAVATHESSYSHGLLHARQHAIDAASDHTGYGDCVTLDVGTSSGTVAAGDHVHDMFSGLAKITVGTSEPSSPSVGDLWVDTN